MGEFLAWLGTANPDVLRRVPSARDRFMQMGAVLLVTASLAVASMSFALHDALQAPWPWAVLLGLGWGAMILTIDRFLVLSIGSTRNRSQLLLMALPRLAMAALLSLAVSTPLVLSVFRSDIKAEVYSQQLQRSQQQAAQIAGSQESRDAAALAQQIAHNQAVLDGHLPDGVTSPALEQAQQQVAALSAQQQQAQAARDAAYEAWQCELYGAGPTCQGASNRVGPGPLAGAKQRQYADAQAHLEAATASLQRATSSEQADQRQENTAQAGTLAAAQQQARSQLPALRSRYAALQAELQRISDAGTSVNFGDTGILAQLQALSQLSSRNGTLLAAHLAVMALFFLIEILPVTIKILLNLQPPTAYDVVAKAGDDKIIEKVNARQARSRRIQEGKTRTRLAVEDHLRQQEEALGQRANRYVAAEQARILDRHLRKWSEQLGAAKAEADDAFGGLDVTARRPSIDVRPINGRPWLPDPESIT